MKSNMRHGRDRPNGPRNAKSESVHRKPRPALGRDRPNGPRDAKSESVHRKPRPALGEKSEPRGERPHNTEPKRERPPVASGEVWLYGHHAVAAALANQERRVLRLLATPEAVERLREDSTVPPGVLNRVHASSRKEIESIVGEQAVHQGVAMLTRPIDHHLEDIIAMAENRDSYCLVMLDQVSDPHNVGAILRSAAAFDAAAVVTLERRAAAETGALAKAASGALDRISFVQITNLARAIEILKDKQFWVVGLEADGQKALSAVDLKGRVAFVLGTEGEGLRRLVRESCDEIARLPINAASESLNVSNAAAVALYERRRQLDAG